MVLPTPSQNRPATPVGEDGPLWSTIKRQLYRSEVAHVKRLVGEALIQKNRLMWDELASLKQILTDFQHQNDELSDGLKQQVLFCGSQHRDLLRRQSQIVLQDIKAQAESCGHELEDIVPELRDSQMRDFIMGGKESRRGLSGKLDGFTPPATPSTRPPSSSGYRPPSSGGRSGCSTPDPIAGCFALPLGRALNIEDLTLVAAGIREALESEHESLLSAIGEQMEHLEVEADHRAQAVGKLSRGEPSTAQLQQFVHKLQELAASPSLRTLTLTGAGGEAASQLLGGSSVRRLQALIAQRRQASPRRPSNPPGLGAVPEANDYPPAGGHVAKPGSAGGGHSAASGVPFDPFFDDPLFAAAVGAGCSSIEEASILS
jgi:hypothetical protein